MTLLATHFLADHERLESGLTVNIARVIKLQLFTAFLRTLQNTCVKIYSFQVIDDKGLLGIQGDDSPWGLECKFSCPRKK